MFLSRSIERQTGHDGKTVVIDYSKEKLKTFFYANFFWCISAKYEFCAYLCVIIFANAV